MRSRSSVLGLLSLLCLPLPALAQTVPTISLGSNDGAPGSEVSIDLSVDGAQSTNTSSAILLIEFPKSALSFIRTESAVPAVAVESRMMPDGPKPDVSTVEVKIGLSAEASSKVLPDQKVGSAYFVVAENATPDTKIPLVAEAKALMGDATTPKSVKAANGEIAVIPSLVFSCFFYMH